MRCCEFSSCWVFRHIFTRCCAVASFLQVFCYLHLLRCLDYRICSPNSWEKIMVKKIVPWPFSYLYYRGKEFCSPPCNIRKKLLVALLASICSTVIALNKCRENVAITENHEQNGLKIRNLIIRQDWGFPEYGSRVPTHDANCFSFHQKDQGTQSCQAFFFKCIPYTVNGRFNARAENMSSEL